jgi:hypothetical protein
MTGRTIRNDPREEDKKKIKRGKARDFWNDCV